MSTTGMTDTADNARPAVAPQTGSAQPAYDGSIWGAPPAASLPAPESAEARPGGWRRRLPETVRTKVAAALAAVGLVVGGGAGIAIGHTTGSGSGSVQQGPAGFGGPGSTQNGQPNGQQGGAGGFGPGQQNGQGTQQGTQQGQGTLPGQTT
jgi:hypothetical protein